MQPPLPLMLERIVADTRRRLDEERAERPLGQLLRGLLRQPADFRRALLSAPAPRVIAEVKPRSPSAGQLLRHLDPLSVAADYLLHGAAALSVLTERDHFGGSPELLKKLRALHPQAPLLMKDFVVDEYQLIRAAHDGADAVLLIMAALGPRRCQTLHATAVELGLTPLVEIHDEKELQSALGLGATLIGVNNRNLHTMQVSLEVSFRLAPLLPPAVMVISESGIERPEDLSRLLLCGYDAALIGTHLVKSASPGAALARLRQEAAAP